MPRAKKFNNGGGTGRVSALMTGVGAGASKHNLFIIDDESLANPVVRDKVMYPVIDGVRMVTGLEKRDWAKYPQAMFSAPPSQMKIIDPSEWDARYDEQEKEQSSLQHIRRRAMPDGSPIPSLDQNGQGYCWAYSTTIAVMLGRARENQPYVRLSAHAVGCMVKNFRDQGGWCGLSALFHKNKGCPSVQFWPEKSMSRSHDKPETWANAALHVVTEDWVDLTRRDYDHQLTVNQIATCCFLNQPGALDYDEWGHSIGWLRWKRVERGSWAPLIINSWKDGWGDLGEGIIRTSWTVDGAVCLLNTRAVAA